jgi:hypothetical protein
MNLMLISSIFFAFNPPNSAIPSLFADIAYGIAQGWKKNPLGKRNVIYKHSEFRQMKGAVIEKDLSDRDQKPFLFSVKDLCAISVTQLLNYCLTAHFVEKCSPFQLNWLIMKTCDIF